jgi:hypothetical protein
MLVGLRLRESAIRREKHRRIHIIVGSLTTEVVSEDADSSSAWCRPLADSSHTDTASVPLASTPSSTREISLSAVPEDEVHEIPEMGKLWIPESEHPLSDEDIVELMVCSMLIVSQRSVFLLSVSFPRPGSYKLRLTVT